MGTIFTLLQFRFLWQQTVTQLVKNLFRRITAKSVQVKNWLFWDRITKYFYIHVTVHRDKFLYNKTNEMH
jgi:hypothetical protein